MKTNINISTPAGYEDIIGCESIIENATKKLNREISKHLKEGKLTITGMMVAIKLAFGYDGKNVQVEHFADFAGMHLFKVCVNGGIYFEVSI